MLRPGHQTTWCHIPEHSLMSREPQTLHSSLFTSASNNYLPLRSKHSPQNLLLWYLRFSYGW